MASDLGGCVAAAEEEEKEEEGRGAGFGCGWIEADLRMGLRLEGRERRGEGSLLCGGRRDWGWRGFVEEQRVGRGGSELDRDLAKRERRRVRMNTETRRLTGVGRGIILPARLRLRCCSEEKEVDAGRERSHADAARRGSERARRRFASPLTDGARGQLRGRSRVVRRRERSGWWWRREAEDERKRRAAQI
jgi:hypothetical protein